MRIANHFQALVRQTVVTAAAFPQFESSPAAICAAAELTKIASVVVGERQGGEPVHEGRPRLERAGIIQRSKDLMEERGGEPVLVDELAAAAGVSERTLRTALSGPDQQLDSAL